MIIKTKYNWKFDTVDYIEIVNYDLPDYILYQIKMYGYDNNEGFYIDTNQIKRLKKDVIKESTLSYILNDPKLNEWLKLIKRKETIDKLIQRNESN